MHLQFGDQPKCTLFDEVRPAVESLLGISRLKSLSALQCLGDVKGPELVALIYDTIATNYELSGASERKNRSRENWRWHSLQPQISPHNTSREVVLERAIARACSELGRIDWANQVPVASGLGERSGDRRRAIDLVRKHGDRHFEFIELKIESDTPLYAAVELLEYASLFLIARSDPPNRSSELLEATKLDLRVLAPRPYYARYELLHLQDELNKGVASLGKRVGIDLSFGFTILHERLIGPVVYPLPESGDLLSLLDQCQPIG